MDKRRMDDGTVLVAFELPAAVDARTVSVCGDFNGWAAHTHPLRRLADGAFRLELPLPAGDRWRFRYLLDQEQAGERWENDWAADDYTPNGLGSDDSVVDLTNPSGLPLAAALAEVPASSEEDRDEPAQDVEVAQAPRRPGLWRRWWRRLTFRRDAPVPDQEPVPDDATEEPALEPAGSPR